MAVFEHEHPLCLVDLQPEYPLYEDEYDDNDELITKQDFRSQCERCEQEITWFHRYYYKCARSCEYSLHKFCGEVPLTLVQHKSHQIIYHPSHKHPLVAILEPLLCKCRACDKEHKGIFYLCSTCFNFFIHSDCAFLPKSLLIQHSTNDAFSHTHPLILSYSFPRVDQEAKFDPLCRVCIQPFIDENLWIYKCDKCRYYAHLDCATSRGEHFMSIFATPGAENPKKNFQDSEYPDLLHLPFPDITHNLQKHLFFKGDSKLGRNYHEHPLTLVLSGCNDTSHPTTSKTDLLLCHNPMERIELLCNACVKPITSEPFYKCDNENEHCKFVIHTWCTQLPAEIKNHPGHPEHTLTLHPDVGFFFSTFRCSVCDLLCNGFVYSCSECPYHIDVTCSFIPENITHEIHAGHILSRFDRREQSKYKIYCHLCLRNIVNIKFMFMCFSCDVYVHAECALLLPRNIQHKLDKHPMRLSYFPIENHKSEYFCEVCEEEFDPERCFYHCHRCAWSIHSACAPSILQSETATGSYYGKNVYEFSNVKFGGILNTKFHLHPLSCVQGTRNNGSCNNCGLLLQYGMIFKCLQCEYAIDRECGEKLSY
uniref:uncharacterized protein LOC122582954 n=1 Tax=Erigeron canadensis TaxID=72917 RepID=UPI001CB919C5|nr:uncharacterized protein LOC122582954 [Erigeron canadensis]